MKKILTIIIFVIFGFMYCEIESMIETKSHDLTNLFLWLVVLIMTLWGFTLIKSKHVIRTNYDKKEELMTVTYSDGTIKQYSGECTVWYKLPDYKRCGTSKEYELTQYWERHRKTQK